MKTTELRIGNLVGIKETALHADGCNHSEAIFEIEEIKKDVVQFKGYHANEYYTDLNPIPLTEQWLLDLGFEVERECYDKGRLSILLADNNNDYYKNGRVFYKSWAIMEAQPKYVHQLQNLYFTLTQEELILK
jgi:hypothetical protein